MYNSSAICDKRTLDNVYRVAGENLRLERVPEDSIHVTGNTVIDALLHTAGLIEEGPQTPKELAELDLPPGRMILVTGHRRENFGPGLANLCQALVDLSERFQDITVVYSVHPNPNVRQAVDNILRLRDRITRFLRGDCQQDCTARPSWLALGRRKARPYQSHALPPRQGETNRHVSGRKAQSEG